MKAKQIIWLLLLISLSIPVFAEMQHLGTFRKGDCVNLVQICDNCTYVNISLLIHPNSVTVFGEREMTKSGTVYNYSYCNTSTLGQYIVNGHGDLNNIDTVWNYDFKVTTSGMDADNAPSSSMIFFILAITGVLFYLGISNLTFSKLDITNFVLKKICIIIAVYLMVLNSTILMAIADNANLGIKNEIFTYVWIFGWGGYILLIYLILSMILKVLKMWNIKKRNERTGEE